MSGVIDALATVCRERFLAEKILIVPSLAVGHQIADRIAYERTSWVNLRAESTRSLADTVVGFDLVRDGLTVYSRAQSLALLDTACAEVLEKGSYFGKLAAQQGLHRAIQRTIDDLRQAKVRLASIDPSAFEDVRKREELQKIIDVYERELDSRSRVDRHGVLRRAVEKLRAARAANETLPFAPRAGQSDTVWMLAML